jgi:hypothetical protein
VQSKQTYRYSGGLIILGFLIVLLFAISPALAEAGGGFRTPTTGTLKSEQPRNVRDHRKPGGLPSGGVKVTVKCKKTDRRCHTH